jgi:hypothetical protein
MVEKQREGGRREIIAYSVSDYTSDINVYRNANAPQSVSMACTAAIKKRCMII